MGLAPRGWQGGAWAPTRQEVVIPSLRALLVFPPFGSQSFWNYEETCEVMGARYSAAPLGLITVAAMLPPAWQVRLVDCNVEQLTDDHLAWADVVFTGGMLPQQRGTQEVIARAQAAGKRAVVGGPDVTATPEVYAAAEFRVQGEAEELVPRLVADLEAGLPGGRYVAKEFPDLTRSPVPRFDLLSLRHYLHVGVQYSRGCPFDCEFCNVIELNGRRPRTKLVPQVLAELETLRALGYRGHVDFVDDNLIGNKARAKPLLRALAAWLAERGHPFTFTTEASINLADDDELLGLMRAANFFAIFVGIETPDAAALEAAHKMQNTRRDLAASIRKIHRAGIFVNAGFIIGFDAEKGRVADAMVECIEAMNVPVCMVGLLYALPGTRLARRLAAEGRLRDDAYDVNEGDADQCTSGLNFETGRPREEMLRDYREVLSRIYDPRAFFGRVRRLCREVDTSSQKLEWNWRHLRRELRAFATFSFRLSRRGPAVRLAYWRTLLDTLLHNPRAVRVAGSFSALYLHYGPFAARLQARLDATISRGVAPERGTARLAS